MKPEPKKPRAGDRLPEVRRKGRKIVRTVSPATGEILEWNPARRAWVSERGNP